jgi:hypothetical protein
MVTTVGGEATDRFQLENKLKICIIFLLNQSLTILGCVAFSVYVSEQMWDFTTEIKLLFKDDIGSCTEAKFIVPDWGIKLTMVAMSNHRFFKIKSFCFPAFIQKNLIYLL